jgi:signal transduction histidine kinase
MRERVTACGGEVDAHPQGSGFRVTATLPVVALAGAAVEVGHR